MSVRFEPREPGFMAISHEAHARLREDGPIYHDPELGIFFVLDYKLALEVMRAPNRFSSRVDRASMRTGGMPAEVMAIREQGWPPALTLSHNDEPSHDEFRKIVAPFFLPRGLARIRPFIEHRTAMLISKLPTRQSVDIVSALAVPLPIAVIGELLGMGHLGDAVIKRWSDAFADEIGFLTSVTRAVEIAHETLECHRAMVTLIEERRGGDGEDVISVLANAGTKNGPLEVPEILSILTQLLVAGNETTTATLTFAVLWLAQDTALWQRLQANRQEIATFVEEILRLESPIQGQFRKATGDEALGGMFIPMGSLLHVRFGSANRDEAVWGQDDNRMKLSGKPAAQHLAFGIGLHFCLGAALSRLELQLALNALLDRFNGCCLSNPSVPLEFRTHFHHRNILSLAVEFQE